MLVSSTPSVMSPSLHTPSVYIPESNDILGHPILYLVIGAMLALIGGCHVITILCMFVLVYKK